MSIFQLFQAAILMLLTLIINGQFTNQSSYQLDSLYNNSVLTDNDIINIGIISCKMHGGTMIRGLIGSLLQNPARHRIHVHLIVDNMQIDYIMKSYCKNSIIPVMEKEFYNVTVVNYEHKPKLNQLFKTFNDLGHDTKLFECALLKTAMPHHFPELKDMLILDSDTVVLEDISSLWSLWMSNRSNKTYGAIQEMELPVPEGFVYFGGKQHYFPPTGLNTGVLFMNMERIREGNLSSERLLEINDEPIKLLDQDLINTWAYYHQDEILQLPCKWNKRKGSHCDDYVCYPRP